MSGVNGIGNGMLLTPLNVNRMVSSTINEKDSDDDGLLNMEELGVSEDTFSKIDSNTDGVVDRVELTKAHPLYMLDQRNTNLIGESDTNGDNLLSAEEYGVNENLFSLIDTNEDGAVDKDELNSFYSTDPIQKAITRVIFQNDSDGDKALNEEESGLSKEQFKKADSNGDGVIDRVELLKSYARASGQHEHILPVPNLLNGDGIDVVT